MFSAAGVVLLFQVETGEVMLKDCCAFICVESVWEIVLCSVKAYPSVPLITADEIHGVLGSPVRFLLLSPLKLRFYSASPS